MQKKVISKAWLVQEKSSCTPLAVLYARLYIYTFSYKLIKNTFAPFQTVKNVKRALELVLNVHYFINHCFKMLKKLIQKLE